MEFQELDKQTNKKPLISSKCHTQDCSVYINDVYYYTGYNN